MKKQKKAKNSPTNQAINAIIRPPRKIYDDTTIPLTLEVDGSDAFVRYPISFNNQRKQKIVGSIYHSVDHPPMNGGPCVIYLHGNSSSQLEGQFLVPNLCKLGVLVFCFDFAGCGQSGGDYISLGYFEKQDTEFLMTVLNNSFHLGPFIVWGRSMGATTALLVDHPLLIGRISDSSFSSLIDMCSAIAASMKFPSIFVPAVVWYLKKKVIKAAKFNIKDVSPVSLKRSHEVPAIFGHAQNDKFIPFEQCKRLYKHYHCKDKTLIKLPFGHNSRRKESWIRTGVSFIFRLLKINITDFPVYVCANLQKSDFHFNSFKAMISQTGPAINEDGDLNKNDGNNNNNNSDNNNNNNNDDDDNDDDNDNNDNNDNNDASNNSNDFEEEIVAQFQKNKKNEEFAKVYKKSNKMVKKYSENFNDFAEEDEAPTLEELQSADDDDPPQFDSEQHHSSVEPSDSGNSNSKKKKRGHNSKHSK